METHKNIEHFDNEYLKEDKKTEIDEEEKPNLNLMCYSCNICQKVYKSKHGLSLHIKSVHEENRYPCDQCQYKAREKGHLKKHIQSVHMKVKYSCDQCGKLLTEQGNLKRHIQSVHERMKYPCDQCGKRFS